MFHVKHFAALILNGDVIEANYPGFVLAADGGFDKLKAFGVAPDAVIGDMDSIRPPAASGPPPYNRGELKNTVYLRFPAEKNQTDGELGLKYLIENGYNHIEIYGAEGGRLDHVLTNLALLKIAADAGVFAVCKCKDYNIYLINKEFECEMRENSLLSLVPFSEKVHIVSTEGLKYPLKNEVIFKAGSRGVSNAATGGTVRVTVAEGETFVFKMN